MKKILGSEYNLNYIHDNMQKYISTKFLIIVINTDAMLKTGLLGRVSLVVAMSVHLSVYGGVSPFPMRFFRPLIGQHQ